MSIPQARQATMDAWRPVIGSPRRLTADDVMTARDVALLLHAPISTVEDWARRGILPSVKVGRRRLYIRQSIEAVLTEERSATLPT
jgi:excisionase family DNA binding protein